MLVALFKWVRQNSLLWFFIIAFLMVISIIYRQILVANNGLFVYLLDDTYIHMAIARNIIQHGIWGVTSHQFSSSSSLLLYPILLAPLFAGANPSTLMPLMLNLLSAILVISIAYITLKRMGVGILTQTIALFSIILIVPLPLMVMIGMEHTLHIAVYLGFLYLIVNHIIKPRSQIDRKQIFLIAISTLLIATVRYEGLFTVGIVTVLLVLRRRWHMAIFVLVISCIPVLIYGFFSINNGSFFLPNSIYTKAALNDSFLADFYPSRIAETILRYPFVYFLAFFAMVLYSPSLSIKESDTSNDWQFEGTYLLIFVGNVFAHGIFARFGWLLRYESYLVATGILLVVVLSSLRLSSLKLWTLSINDHRLLRVIFPVVFSFVLIQQSLLNMSAYRNIANFSHYIYSQHIQLGSFAGQYYYQDNIVASDIGAIAFEADPQLTCLDLLQLNLLERVFFYMVRIM